MAVILCYEEEVKERDLKFNKIIKSSFSMANRRNRTMLFCYLFISLLPLSIIVRKRILILNSALKWQKGPFSPRGCLLFNLVPMLEPKKKKKRC